MRDTVHTVLVSGGRDHAEPEIVFAALDTMLFIHGQVLVVHGSARGVDTFSEQWAKSRQQLYMGCPAEWDKYGKAAGMHRNREMAELCLSKIGTQNSGVVFRGGRGTLGMYRILDEIRKEGGLSSLWLPEGEFWK